MTSTVRSPAPQPTLYEIGATARREFETLSAALSASHDRLYAPAARAAFLAGWRSGERP